MKGYIGSPNFISKDSWWEWSVISSSMPDIYSILIRPGGIFLVMRSFTRGERGWPEVEAIRSEGDIDEVESEAG